MVIITGTSRGIGKALAELYLRNGQTVIGIGRTSSIEHVNYTHLFCDLSNSSDVAKIQLPSSKDELIFIHNAGILGTVNRFSELDQTDAEAVMQVNFNAGVSLLHHLVRKLEPEQQFTGVFISSGAGKRPIPSWAAYCASKAAVDLFLSTFQAEENEKENSTVQVYAFSPGVVDTEMQSTIRSVEESKFSASQRFHDLHASNELLSPNLVAQKLSQLIQNRPTDQVLWSVTDIQ